MSFDQCGDKQTYVCMNMQNHKIWQHLLSPVKIYNDLGCTHGMNNLYKFKLTSSNSEGIGAFQQIIPL